MPRFPRPVLLSAIAVGAAAALLLAGCASSSGSPSSSSGAPTTTAPTSATTAAAGCTTPVSGSVSDSVKVSADSAKTPTVTLPSGFSADTLQRTVLDTGTGAAVGAGDLAQVEFALYDGTGKVIVADGWDSASVAPLAPIGTGALLPGLEALFGCGKVGDRAVVTSSAQASFGSGVDVTQYGLTSATQSIVWVGKIVSALPIDAVDGPAAGFPTVKLASGGKPTITIPAGEAAPTQTEVEVLKKGTGDVVAGGDTVTVKYQGVIWKTGKVFDQSYTRSPNTSDFEVTQVVPGFSKALIGRTVGSQVLVVMPPSDGYGSGGNSQAGIAGTDTLVFFVEIEKTAPTPAQ